MRICRVIFLSLLLSSFGQSIFCESVANVKDYYADQFCGRVGTFDESCLSNAITAAGNNSHIILGAHVYSFNTEIVVSNLVNVVIDGPGATIKKNQNAFRCMTCTGGGFTNITFNSVTSPKLVACSLGINSIMSCPSLPQTGVLAIDPWGKGIGHIPTIDDQSLLVAPQSLNDAQTKENFDTGIEYIDSNGINISGLKGKYFHIVVLDSSNFTISDNAVMGGTGVTRESIDGGQRCAAICIWTKTPKIGIYSNLKNKIFNNTVTYAASRSIGVIAADETLISGNYMEYAGEGGVVMGQTPGYQSIHTSVIGNTARHSLFDGFDLSSCFPNCQGIVTGDVVKGNVSSYNFHTGFIGNGLKVTFTNNLADHNVGAGFTLDFADSTISHNLAYNNVGNYTNGQVAGQFIVGLDGITPPNAVDGNVIIDNHAIVDDAKAHPYGFGIAIQGGAKPNGEKASGNYVVGGFRTFQINPGCASCPPVNASDNYDDVNGMQNVSNPIAGAISQ